jgi:hypothetical protein
LPNAGLHFWVGQQRSDGVDHFLTFIATA